MKPIINRDIAETVRKVLDDAQNTSFSVLEDR